MKSVFSYSDHKKFLRDFYHEQKSLSSSFSFRSFATKAGMKSPNFLKYVIDGEKNLSLSAIHKLAGALALNENEHRYFEAMVHKNQADSTPEKNYYKAVMKDFSQRQSPVEKRSKEPDIFARWYYPAVLVAIDSVSVKESIERVGSLTGLEKAQICEVIDLFSEKNVLSVEDDIYRVCFDNLVVGNGRQFDPTMKRFLSDQLQLSNSKFKSSYGKRARFFSQTLTISKDRFEELVVKMQTFLDETTSRTNSEPVEEVVQINSQIFSMSDSSRI